LLASPCVELATRCHVGSYSRGKTFCVELEAKFLTGIILDFLVWTQKSNADNFKKELGIEISW